MPEAEARERIDEGRTMGRPKECRSCNGKKQQSQLFHPFWDVPNSRGYYVDDWSDPTLCFKCIETLKEEDNGGRKLIGFLRKDEKKEYVKNVSSAEHRTLIKNGAVVLEEEKLKETMNRLTLLFHKSVRERDIKKLNETFSLNGKVGKNPQRVWANIYSTENGDMRNNRATMEKYNALCSQLLTSVSSKLVPHKHFALLAHRNFVGRSEQTNDSLFEGNGSIRKRSVQKLRELEDTLMVEKVNVLGRGPMVDRCQTPHIDGNTFKLLLLLVDYTAGNGLYEFKYFPSSHNIEDVGKYEWEVFPLNLMESIYARQGTVIAFYEKTIHGGGRGGCVDRNDAHGRMNHNRNCGSSDRILHNDYIDGKKWFKGYESVPPTDISFQLALRYGDMTDSSNSPNATNTWLKGSTLDEYGNGDGLTEIEEDFKRSVTLKKAENDLTVSDQSYMKIIAFAHRGSRRMKRKEPMWEG